MNSFLAAMTWGITLALAAADSPLSTATTATLPSALTADEQRDLARYPNIMRYIKQIETKPLMPTPAGNEQLIKTSVVFQPEQKLWDGFFKAAIEDRLTNLRALSLIAREFKSRQVTIYGTGSAFEDAVLQGNIDLGLAIPARNIGLALWQPDPKIEDPEFLLHLIVVYREPFIHQFPDEVMPANLKIGFGDEIDYYFHDVKRRGYLVTADIYYGPHGVGFRNVKGVGAQKRGFAGLLQTILFFMPDAVTSMMIDEGRNAMVTEAFINTVVEGFETREVYRIRYRQAR